MKQQGIYGGIDTLRQELEHDVTDISPENKEKLDMLLSDAMEFMDKVSICDVADPTGDMIQEAQDAFWEVIADRHPEITTGDLDPASAMAFSEACRDVAENWVSANSLII